MAKQIVYLQKSNKNGKKYMVYIDGKTVHFGATGYSDYTIHKDKERMQRYNSRHKAKENWTKSGIKSAGFWAKWLLWNKPTLSESITATSKKFGIIIKKSTFPFKKSKSRK
jgi:hypothetical protein